MFLFIGLCLRDFGNRDALVTTICVGEFMSSLPWAADLYQHSLVMKF